MQNTKGKLKVMRHRSDMGTINSRIILEQNLFNYDSDRDLLIRQAVTANMFYTITAEELAFLCNMTLSTFKRHFGKIYGTSPSKWILAKRMEKAAQYLP